MVDIFWTRYQHPHADQRRRCNPSEPHCKGKALPFSRGSEALWSRPLCAHVNSTCSLKTSHTQGFLYSPSELASVLTPQHWNYRHMPPHLALKISIVWHGRVAQGFGVLVGCPCREGQGSITSAHIVIHNHLKFQF